MNKIKEASRLLQSDFLLYIQLNGELARENLRLQEKLREYQSEATADAKGEDVMSHGGISIDEGIVPFIKIKAVENNG